MFAWTQSNLFIFICTWSNFHVSVCVVVQCKCCIRNAQIHYTNLVRIEGDEEKEKKKKKKNKKKKEEEENE